MTFCFLLLSLATANGFSQTPPQVGAPVPVTPSKPQLDEEETQALVWLGKLEEEHGHFKKVAEGKYIIKSNTDVKDPDGMSDLSDIWTLRKSEDGEFEVDGLLKGFPGSQAF